MIAISRNRILLFADIFTTYVSSATYLLALAQAHEKKRCVCKNRPRNINPVWVGAVGSKDQYNGYGRNQRQNNSYIRLALANFFFNSCEQALPLFLPHQ